MSVKNDEGAANVSASAVTEAAAKEAFAELRPVCVEVMRAPSLEALRSLDRVVSGQMTLHPHLVDYVVLPLRMIIRKTGSSNMRLVEGTLNSVSLVIERVRGLQSQEVFDEFFAFTCMLLDSKMASQAGYTSCSEDLVVSVLKVLKALLLSTAESLRAELYSRLAAVGHCVSVLLETLHSYQARAVRRHALGTLLALDGVDEGRLMREAGLLHTDSDTSPDPTHCLRTLVGCVGVGREGEKGGGGEAGRVFASFLPGIAMSLNQLVTTDTKVGQAVISLTLLVWAHYVCLVLNDSDSGEEQAGLQFPTKPESTSTSSPIPIQKSLTVERTRRWRVETDHKLSVLVHRMASLVTHDNWRVRFTMALWAHSLLSHCHRSLVSCMPSVLEVLVTLTHDDYQQVATIAQQGLELFSQQYAKEGSRLLTSVLEERLHALATALPRLMRQHDDTRKLSTLQLLAGYLQLLGSHVISLVHSHPHLTRITQALLQTLKLEEGDMRIVEQPTLLGDSWRVPLHFQHFRAEKIESLLHHVCQLLGFYGSLPVLLDHLTDLFCGSALWRKETTIMISHLLLGASGRECVQGRGKPPHGVSPEELFSLVEGLVEVFLTPNIWRGKSRNSEEDPILTSHNTTLLSCLLLDTLRVCVEVVGQPFNQLMQLLAYPLMEKLGHSNTTISNYALATLETICSHCGYNSLQQLITENADYLVNSAALQLRSGPVHNPEAIQVIQAVLTHGVAEVLPLMEDCVAELLISLDLREDPALLWPALLSLSTAAARWAPTEKASTSDKDLLPIPPIEEVEECSPLTHPTPEQVKQFFLEYHRKKERERWTEIQDEGEDGERVGEDGSERKEEEEAYTQKQSLLPAHKAAVNVMQRCIHHLSTPSPSLRLTILDALRHCLTALRAEQNTLLPEVHNVWPAFLPRLSDPTPVVALRALEVLWVMCDVCRDFLRRRVVQGVWPPIIHSLESLASKSSRTDKLYRQTANFKLQRKLLESVAILCAKLDLSSDAELLAHACIPYLSTEQPEELVQTCQTSLASLVQRNPDTMWLILQQLCPQQVAVPPHPTLKPFKFAAFPDAPKFIDSAQALLQLTL